MILVAENDIDLCRFYAETLGGLGLDFALDGADLVKRATQKPYRLLWVDLVMPMVSGSEAMRQIRRSGGPNATTSIVAITGLPPDEISREDIDGFDWIFQKPVAFDTIQKIFTWASETEKKP